MTLRGSVLLAALLGMPISVASALAGDAVRVQAEGVAPLPALIRGAPRPKPPDAAALRALRQIAVADGIDNAVLSYAAQLARIELRGDEQALRAGLGGRPGDFAIGHGVSADLGAREAKTTPGAAPAPPRKPTDPVPMEHAWRVEALVDGARVRAALEAAGLALTPGADSGATAELELEAPYDAPMLAALRERLAALGARSVVPRRYRADGITLSVQGLRPDLLRERIGVDPPAGYGSEVLVESDPSQPIRVRLRPTALGAARESAKSAP